MEKWELGDRLFELYCDWIFHEFADEYRSKDGYQDLVDNQVYYEEFIDLVQETLGSKPTLSEAEAEDLALEQAREEKKIKKRIEELMRRRK